MTGMMVQLLGFFLGLLGFVGAVVATVLPHWRRTAYVGSNIITVTLYMKGLWMACVWHSTGIYQCEVHRSMLALPPDLQAARALMVLSCVVSTLAALVSSVGMKCTRFARHSPTKRILALSGGACFLCAGLLCLVTVSWTTNDIVVDFYDPFLPSGMKYEIGLAVYLGYASACLSLAGGMVLCWDCGGAGSRQGPHPLRLPRRGHRTRRYQQPPHHHHHQQHHQQQQQQHPPPPLPGLSALSSPAPPYHSPAALKDNRPPSLSSASSSGYRLSDYV